jgi:YbbR domain-containing protein
MKKVLVNFGKSFLNDFKTIIFALVLSLIVWLAISLQLFPNIERAIEVEISAEPTIFMLDRSLELSEGFDESLTVRVEGKRYDVGRLSPEDFRVYLDLSEITEAGVHEAYIRIEPLVEQKFELTTPQSKRTVTIIQTDERTMQIYADIQNVGVREGMMIHDMNITVSPSNVKIRGEQSVIDSIDRVHLLVESDEPLSSTVRLSGELVFLSGDGDRIDVTEHDIQVEDRAFIVNIPVYKPITLPLDVTIINAPSNFDINSLINRMSIEPKELTIGAPDNSIDNRDFWSLGTISLHDISLRELRDGLTIDITLPDGFINLSGDTQARLTFEDVDYGEMNFNVPSSNFTFINEPPGFDITSVTNVVRVNVVGPSDVLGSMSATDINGVVNFAGRTDISAGVMSIRVKFTVSGTNVRRWVIGDEYEINIDIKEAE